MRLLLHTALLATAAIAAPAPLPDCGRGGYNSWGGDASTCAEVDTNRGRGAYNEWEEKSKVSTDADTTSGRGAFNSWDEIAKKSSPVDTNGGRGAYKEVEEHSKRSANADFGRRWHRGRDSQRGSCDLRNAVMPAGKFSLQHHTHAPHLRTTH